MKSNHQVRDRLLAGAVLAAFGLAAAGCASSSVPSTSSPSNPAPKPAAPASCLVIQKIGNDGNNTEGQGPSTLVDIYNFKLQTVTMADLNQNEDWRAANVSLSSSTQFNLFSPAIQQSIAEIGQTLLPPQCPRFIPVTIPQGKKAHTPAQ